MDTAAVNIWRAYCTAAQLILGTAFGASILGSDEPWIKFLAGIGAIMLTFLAGAELDPVVFRKSHWKEASVIGLVALVFSFLGCAAIARSFCALHWEVMPQLVGRGRHVHHLGRSRIRRDA